IEQDADVVMFVYREEYYLSRTEPDQNTEAHTNWYEKMAHVQGTAELILGKQRHGPIGRVRLAFDANITRFGNLEVQRSEAPEF
ncbi:MAG: DnaB-like helicase C-terminal domain-containing protein, partial [Pseudomonadota bacterium]